MPTLAEVKRIVHNSAIQLDSEVPGWEKLINLKKLDMNAGYSSNEFSCICRQLQKLGHLKDVGDMNYDRGFWVSGSVIGGEIAGPVLTDLWKAEVNSRLKKVKASPKNTGSKKTVKEYSVIAIDLAGYAFFPPASQLVEPLLSSLYGSYTKLAKEDLDNECDISQYKQVLVYLS